jgi:hypothetical protein
LPSDLFRPSFEPGSYLAFLGRLTVEKGPEAAIRIAHAAKMPLRIAAMVPRGERKYFKEKLEPQKSTGIMSSSSARSMMQRNNISSRARLLYCFPSIGQNRSVSS